MAEFLQKILLCFIPLFVAIDPVGNLPIFISLTDDLTEDRRQKLLRAALITAFGISVVFLASGKLVFNILGITDTDFRIGGGLVLLIFAIKDLLFSSGHSSGERGDVGIVPLGVPLIIGPAALTSIIFLTDSQGFIYTLIALMLVLTTTWIMFAKSGLIFRLIGPGGSKAFAKIASLFLSAIAVNMIRIGITHLFKPT